MIASHTDIAPAEPVAAHHAPRRGAPAAPPVAANTHDSVTIPAHFPPDWAHHLVVDMLKPGLDFRALAAHIGVSFTNLAALINSPEVQAESGALNELAQTRTRLLAASAGPRSINKLITIIDAPLPDSRGTHPDAESRAWCRHADLAIRAINALARHTRPSSAPTTDPRGRDPRTTDPKPRRDNTEPHRDAEPRRAGKRPPDSQQDRATGRGAEGTDSANSDEPSGSHTPVPSKSAPCFDAPKPLNPDTNQGPRSVIESCASTSSPPRRTVGCHGFQPVGDEDSNTSSSCSPPPLGRTTETINEEHDAPGDSTELRRASEQTPPAAPDDTTTDTASAPTNSSPPSDPSPISPLRSSALSADSVVPHARHARDRPAA